MTVGYQPLQQWIAHGILLAVASVTTIGCQPNASTVSSPSASLVPTPVATGEVTPGQSPPANPAVRTQGTYRSDRFGFQFNYPQPEFVVQEATASPGDPKVSGTIDIWTEKHAQAILSGTYDQGTEYPANVRVMVFQGSQPGPLQMWVQQHSNAFGPTREFKPTTVAQQPAIRFQSSGLYENEHLAFADPKGATIIVITLSKINYGENDAIYRRAFEQVVNSFMFTNG